MAETRKGRPPAKHPRHRAISLYLTDAQYKAIERAAKAANDPLSRYCIRIVLTQIGTNS